ncbi:hypothetical protein NC652_000804 [Populus alba x Populus x berolinensis]|nr:hypothetical protein NC652_000804 [Populus alba x Populus x berolinensis]
MFDMDSLLRRGFSRVCCHTLAMFACLPSELHRSVAGQW